ncbi:LysR substrate-binding domain-containing protein [Sphingomonas bacterium]|uniref:LysR substrate-binding domain-containing protein n=1 Tax=Sphingomonas bacterium TaxID=1895847 RepID=UPI001575C54C|nr:LysR substrate-binding domain-containing protein [Sphingomonas bacterium]
MKLTQIRHLVAVADGGGLGPAAAASGVSRQVLLRSIREIEQELGTALFRHGDRPAALTPAGEMFVRRAAAALADLGRATDEIHQTSGSSGGLVSLGLSADAHHPASAGVLAAFRARFGDIRLRIVEGSFEALGREVRDGVLDFYIGQVWLDRPTDGLKIDRLHDVARSIVVRPGHPLAGATSLAELGQARWIASSRCELDAVFGKAGLPRPRIETEAGTGLGMLSAVAASDAALIVSASWLPLIERTGLATALPLEVPLDALPIHVATRTRLPLTPAAAYLKALIVQASSSVRPLA